MKHAATSWAPSWTREELASWENEGGAISCVPNAIRHPVATVGLTFASIMDPVSAPLRGADNGITDTNSLTILRVSLLLLVPALGSIAIFWGAAAVTGPR
jgi:hypothetical protein